MLAAVATLGVGAACVAAWMLVEFDTEPGVVEVAPVEPKRQVHPPTDAHGAADAGVDAPAPRLGEGLDLPPPPPPSEHSHAPHDADPDRAPVEPHEIVDGHEKGLILLGRKIEGLEQRVAAAEAAGEDASLLRVRLERARSAAAELETRIETLELETDDTGGS
jgi:hypothetical protein